MIGKTALVESYITLDLIYIYIQSDDVDPEKTMNEILFLCLAIGAVGIFMRSISLSEEILDQAAKALEEEKKKK